MAKPTTAQRTKIRTLRKALFARDAAQVRQGIDDTRDTGDPIVFDNLLEAITKHLEDTGLDAPFRRQARLGVLGYAPAGTQAAAERQTITSLTIGGLSGMDLTPISHFDNLETLTLRNMRDFDGMASLKALPKLRSIVFNNSLRSHLAEAMGGLTALRKVWVDSPLKWGFLPTGIEEIVYDGSRDVFRPGFASKDALKGIGTLINLRRLLIDGSGVVDLDDLEGLDKLQHLDLGVAPHLRCVAGLAHVPQLERFRIGAAPKLATLQGMESLTALQVDHGRDNRGQWVPTGRRRLELQKLGITDLQGLPPLALDELSVDRCELRTLDGLEALPSLRALRVTDCKKLRDVSAVAAQPELVGIDLYGSGGSLAGEPLPVSPLGAMPNLKRLRLRRSGVADLGGLADNASLKWLDLGETKLTDLKGLEGLHTLEALSITHCTSLTDLSALADLPNVVRIVQVRSHWSWFEYPDGPDAEDARTDVHPLGYFSLVGSNALTSLEGLSGLTGITRLRLKECTALTDLGELQRMPQLIWLDLEGCTLEDISPVGSLEELTHLNMAKCKSIRPKPRRKTLDGVDAVGPYLRKLRGEKAPRRKPKAGTRLNASSRHVRDLFHSRDLDNIRQAAALAAAPEVADALLSGVTVAEGSIVPNGTFSGTGPAQPYLNLGLRWLIAQGGGDAAAALRRQVTEVVVDAPQAALLTDADSCAGLTALRRLVAQDAPGLTSLGGLSELRVLEEVDLRNASSLTSLEGLSSPALRTLRAKGCAALQDLDGLTGEGLVEASFEDCGGLLHVDGLSSHTDLTRLTLSGCRALTGIDGLTNLTSMRELDLQSCSELSGTDALAGMTDLRELNLLGVSPSHQADTTNWEGARTLFRTVQRERVLLVIGWQTAEPSAGFKRIFGDTPALRVRL